MVIVAQLVRALVCGAGGRGFESHQSPIKLKRELNNSLFFIIKIFLSFALEAVLIGSLGIGLFFLVCY